MRFGRRLRFVFLLVCAVAYVSGTNISVAPFGIEFGVTKAFAQQERSPGLLELLFRRKEPAAAPKPQPKVKKVTPAKKKTVAKPRIVKKKQVVKRSAAASASAAEPETVTQKSETARKVLVVGDFIADGMGQGLADLFVDVANVAIEIRANGSSGLVRNDFYNWPVEIGPIIEEIKPALVVVLLGSNDRQDMRIDGKSAKVRSDEWVAEYKKRVDAFALAVRQTNTPLVWVGAPPFKFRNMSADILAFNEIYRQAAASTNGLFVDIWDGFVDENGNFLLTGADVKGQQVRLRASDGINFTSAGKQKMAFYVERQIKPLLGDAASPLLTSLGNENAPMLILPPLQTEADLDRTNPIALDDPELDGGSILLGDVGKDVASVSNNPLQAKSVRRRLVEDGLPPPDQPGRSGSFAWPG